MERTFRFSILGPIVLFLVSCGGGDNNGSATGATGPQSSVASVTVAPGQLALSVGQSQQLTAATRDQAGNQLSGRTVAWATTDPAVATVSTTGVVTGMGAGSATITATSEGKSGNSSVTVTTAAVATVTVTPSVLSLLVGESHQLTAVTLDQAGNQLSGRTVTWTTSDAAFATVSSSGAVVGISAGSATITATSEGMSGSAEVSVGTSVTYSSVTTGGAHSCALGTNGITYCWGRGESGQLGVAPPSTTCPLDGGTFPCSLVPLEVVGELAFSQLAGGGAHTCGLTSDGTAYCWGSNTHGQLGDNSPTDRHAPVPVATALRFTSIDAGASHSCGLTSAGAGYCWGRNDRGQLGDGTTVDQFVPVAVAGTHEFQSISAGGFNVGQTCALASNGNVYCWGDNERGQLGIGSSDLDAHPLPVLVAGAGPFTAVTTGLGRHTCRLSAVGVADCWGENTYGGLGMGSTADSPTPVAVSGGLAFEQLVAGGFIGHTCGRTVGGAAYCWGENERGQVGDGSTVDRLEPSAVTGGLSYSSLDAGFRHTCGQATSGAIYCWGSGAAGQLGTNSTSQSAVPVKVQDPSTGSPWDY